MKRFFTIIIIPYSPRRVYVFSHKNPLAFLCKSPNLVTQAK